MIRSYQREGDDRMSAVSLGLKILKIGVSAIIKNDLVKDILEELADAGIGKVEEFCKQHIANINHLLSLQDSEMEKQNIPQNKRNEIREHIIEFICDMDLEDIAEACKFDESKLGEALAVKYREMYEQDEEYDYIYHQRMLHSLAKYALESITNSKDFDEKLLIKVYQYVDALRDGQRQILRENEKEHCRTRAIVSDSINQVKDRLEEIQNIDVNTKKLYDVVKDTKVMVSEIYGGCKKTAGTKKKVDNRYCEYKNEWKKNLFLNRPKIGQRDNIPITLSDLYIDLQYTIGSSKDINPDLETLLLNDIVLSDVLENRMLVILGQPGIGKSSLISWFINKIEPELNQTTRRDVLVYRFSDFKELDWADENITERILEQIGHTYKDMSGKILFIDGFDEIAIKGSRIEVLNCLYRSLASNENIENFCMFITCRENYMLQDKLKRKIGGLECSYITLHPLNKDLIDQYYKTYLSKINAVKDEAVLSVLQKNKDVFGIPIILYMTLALNVKIENETSVVDVYDRIFALNGGFYDTIILRNSMHWTVGDEKKKCQIREISQEFALWMYQNNPNAAVIDEKEYKKIVKNSVGILQVEDVLISNYFKYCEGVDTHAICFVHRTIYEYFVADKIATEIWESFKENEDDIKLMGRILRLIEKGELSKTIRDYLELKIKRLTKESNDTLESLCDWLEDCFDKILKKGFAHYSKWNDKRLMSLMNIEANCFSHFIIILSIGSHLIEDRVVMNGKNSCGLDGYIKLAILSNNSRFKVYLSNYNLKRVMLRGINLRGAHLEGTHLEESNLFESNLEGANLFNANLERARLGRSHLEGACLVEAHLEGIHLEGARLIGANLKGVFLKNAHMGFSNLDEAILERAHLEGADLKGAHLKKTILKGAHLEGAHLERAHLEGAHLEGAYLKGTHLENAYLERAHLRKACLEDSCFDEADLKRAHLEGAHLERAHLKRVHLRGVYLRGAHLERAHLEGAHLEGAHLEGAHLKSAYLKGTHLEGAHLERSSLKGAKLEDADLRGANLEGAIMYFEDYSEKERKKFESRGVIFKNRVV